MKSNTIYLIMCAFVFVGCAKKQFHLQKSEVVPLNSISLDVYHSKNEKNRIESVLNSKVTNKLEIILDKKKYESTLLKSILDTIKGNYSFEIDNNKNLLKINRIHQ